jgi:hypothetical protein
MAKSWGDDMIKANFSEDLPPRYGFREPGRVPFACLSGQRGVHIVHTFVQGRPFDPHVGPFLVVLASLLHEVLYSRRHDFAVQTVIFVGRSGVQRERLWGYLPLVLVPSKNPGVWDPYSSSSNGPGLVDP